MLINTVSQCQMSFELCSPECSFSAQSIVSHAALVSPESHSMSVSLAQTQGESRANLWSRV
jgi:hypothetical protein